MPCRCCLLSPFNNHDHQRIPKNWEQKPSLLKGIYKRKKFKNGQKIEELIQNYALDVVHVK
ncbi:MAG: hypothetical protein ACFFG0_22810 [Candidatus Thorarchaeota archaeon]